MLAKLGVARPYVIHVGAIEPRKNLADLIDAHQVLVDAGHDLDLVLVGTSPKGISVSLPSGAAGRVKQLGFVHDDAVPVLLRHAAAAAYPSIEEGFGLPVLEALAVGTSVVTTEASVMADVGGEAVRCVPAGDVAALAGALADAVSESAIEKSRQFHVRIERAARFTWHASASAHASLYRSLN